MSGKYDTQISISNETVIKILKILGIDDENTRKQALSYYNSATSDSESFKVLIIVRGLVDKFSSKGSLQKYSKHSKHPDPVYQKIREISDESVSPLFDIEKFLQGNEYFLALHKTCKLTKIKLLIPSCIILNSGLGNPIELWSNSKGFVKSATFDIIDLKEKLKNFPMNPSPDSPSFVMRYEYHNSNKTFYQTFFYKESEIENVIEKFNETVHFKSAVLISQFIKYKGNLPTKLRVHFTKKTVKMYSIISPEPIVTHKNMQIINLTFFIPLSLLNSLINSQEELALFQETFNCKLIFPIKSTTTYFLKPEHMLEFALLGYQIIHSVLYMISIALNSEVYKIHKTKLTTFYNYLKQKKVKIDGFLKKNSKKKGKVSAAVQRKKWEKRQMACVFDKSSKIYEIINLQKSETYDTIYQEILNSIRSYIPSNKKIIEAVMDFIETNQSIYLIKILRIRFTSKKIVSLPVISSLKHISLFSATEGSGFSKGKKNRQLLCCGDYCSLLKKNDFETREKIEFLMKHHLEYAGTLFELMKLQDILNIDTIKHLLDRTKRPVTPITTKMQYKILRKVILEDRSDKYSLRSLILNLPSELIRDLNIILQDNTNVTALNIYIEKYSSSNIALNKKLNWEFELVPVCDKCYKIYSKRVKSSKENDILNKMKNENNTKNPSYSIPPEFNIENIYKKYLK
jgi:hypothetical protein